MEVFLKEEMRIVGLWVEKEGRSRRSRRRRRRLTGLAWGMVLLFCEGK
jgi:hypothetical protein